ncbi:RtcB family protein [Sphaerisporangium fuscum]|uniref:RtcB family protein n=1 Tax=Sphaerisporangium fuscum TaxID=2835868 RepID=UPI001BDBFEB6|nr:RtcB family protein [Sphaerisporangium fuscum]
MRLERESEFRYRMEPEGLMRVPGVVFASPGLLPEDQALRQVADVACLPGIVGASYAMPDVHWGYGFPIGGVAATDVGAGGVVSPGGVGFDISCGVRLLAVDLQRDRLRPLLERLMDELGGVTPRGLGGGGLWRVTGAELSEVLYGGARYAVRRGHGVPRDLERCEDHGAVPGADPGRVGDRAVERGLAQVGSLGSGNHFLEVQAVEEIYDPPAAAAFGLRPGQVCVMIHCGSRGLGHQICVDHVRVMGKAMRRYGVRVPDRQLACAPVDSPEGRAYLGAMAAAANYGRANRQLLAEAVRGVFGRLTGAAVELVYDVSHNLAKIEEHGGLTLCVHRKGATRALPPRHPELPADLAACGQPVLVPGTMGTASYVLAGVAGGEAFHSTCHGAGRSQSRHEAARRTDGRRLREELEACGIAVRGSSWRGLAEEAPTAYKDVEAVVAASAGAGLCRKVARLVPVGVVKG